MELVFVEGAHVGVLGHRGRDPDVDVSWMVLLVERTGPRLEAIEPPVHLHGGGELLARGVAQELDDAQERALTRPVRSDEDVDPPELDAHVPEDAEVANPNGLEAALHVAT